MTATAAALPAMAQPPGGSGSQVTAGLYHTCARDGAGRAYCWGESGAGQTGSESDDGLRVAPAVVAAGARPAGVTYTQIAAGHYRTCGLGSDGKVYCWGASSEPDNFVPVAVNTDVILTSVAAGNRHICGLGEDARAYCWGGNAHGQLGDGSTTDRSAPVAVDTGVTFTRLAVGADHTCGLGTDQVTYCWGQNTDGRLGDGSTTNRSAPVAVTGGVTFTELTAGGYHTCGLGSDEVAYCWGGGVLGQLGDGDVQDRPAPVPVAAGVVPSGVTFTQLSAGGTFTCGLGSNAAAYCWGFSYAGQVGDGGTTDQPRQESSPVAVVAGEIPPGVTLTRLSAGGGHTCATGSDANIYCWGNGGAGQLGDGDGLSKSSPVAVSTLAQPPTGVTVTPGDRQAVVSWTAPANFGSGTLTGYTATASPGGRTCASPTPTTCTITGLTNSTAYTVTVTATTTAGTSAASIPSAPATPFAGPQPPTAVTATPGDQQVVVSWTAAGLGSGALTGYTATASPGGRTCASPAPTTCTITGLTNSTAYTVTVTATTTAGTSAASAPSAPVTPFAGPQPPTGVTATPGDTQAVVSWTAPANLGSGTLTGYTATASPDGRTCITAGPTNCTITGLTNSTPYTVTVTATTTAGTSTVSTPSAPVTPFTAPQPPSGVTATPGDERITVSWTAPANLGSGALTGYTATASPGGRDCTTPAATTCTITGLTNSTAYTVTVTATTTAGTSAASAPSAPATPFAAPQPPTGVTATPGDTQAVVSWTAPANLGSGTLTGYIATASPGGKSCTTTGATTCTITGLTNGAAYTVTVTASTTADKSAASSPSAPVTPSAGLKAPSGVTVTAGDRQITVSWDPAQPGTETPIKYTATASPSGKTCTISSSSIHGGLCTIHGLTNGTAYTVTMIATNKSGTSPPTAPSGPVTPVASPPAGRPQPPVVTAAQPQNETIAVSWNPGSPGAGTLLGYTATATATTDPCAATTTPCVTTASKTATRLAAASADPAACSTTDAQTCTITGLINGTSYLITVTTHTTTGDSEVDSTGPVVNTTPHNGALVRGTRFTTTVKAQDPAGIGRSYLTGPDGVGRADSYTEAEVPTGKDGNRTVTWIVLDRLGNQTTAWRTVTVDNTAPAVALRKAPKNGAKLTKATTITATANDRNGIARVQLIVNGKPVASDTRPEYAFALNPARYGKKLTVKIRAYDRAGNARDTGRRTYHR
ncbi:hypothetical protein Ait01nite_013070 [Actinoplanes italicus]|nr:hypothetical protein Ait01nite_013070 [Actinoplanes italicus]